MAQARDAVLLGTPAVELIRSFPQVDLALLRKSIGETDRDALAKLERILTTARQPVSSYEASRVLRP